VDLDQVKVQPATRNAGLSNCKHTLRNILIAGMLLLLLAFLVFVFHSQILTSVANYLIINDRLQPADAIFLLNSDFDTRPFHAADLYKQGLAPVVVIAMAKNTPVVNLGLVPNDTDISIGVMEKLGMPPERITVLPFPGGTNSTFDEAVAFKQYAEENHVQRIILVTSAFHTRRARWIFEKTLAGLSVSIEMAAVPYADFDQTNWWKNETGLITLNNEYIKLVYYYFKYR
jgi:uncharacterized SAM-binding protein YcdF (DUF218 family)